MNAISLIAKARATPEEAPPIRWPGVHREMSDVKHLWHQAQWRQIVKTGTAGNPEEPPLGGELLPSTTHVAFLVPDAVAPIVHTMSNTMSISQVAFGQWTFAPPIQTVGMNAADLNTESTYWFIPLRETVNSGEGATSLTVPSILAEINPVMIRDGKGMQVGSGLPDLFSTLTPTDLPVPETPMFYSLRNKASYVLGFGNSVYIKAQHVGTTGTEGALATGAGITVRMSFVRYNGTDQEVNSASFSLTVAAGATAGQVLVTRATEGAGLFFTTPGYIRARIDSIELAAPTTGSQYYSILRFQVACVLEGADYRYWTQPVSESFADAKYLFRQNRITAASLRVTNVTSMLQIGGDVGAGLCRNHLGGWYNQNMSSLLTAAGAPRLGYRGPAAKGAYTWMQLSEGLDEPVDNTHEWGPYGTSVARVMLDRTANRFHFIWLDTGLLAPQSAATAGASNFSAQLRADIHMEYYSSSPLANNRVSTLDVEDLSRANMILAAAPLAYCNPLHLGTIWSAIRKAGTLALKAGASSVARAALEALLA